MQNNLKEKQYVKISRIGELGKTHLSDEAESFYNKKKNIKKLNKKCIVINIIALLKQRIY